MELIKPNPVLEFNDNQLENVRKSVGYSDLNRLKQDIQQLYDWIQKQRHYQVKDFDLDYLERLLIYNKGSIERTKLKFDRLCTCTNLMPEFLQNFDIKNEFVHKFNVTYTCVLPKPTEDNYRVLVTSTTGEDDDDFLIIHYYRYLLVLGHYMLCNDYCHGYEWIGDCRNITMGLAFKMNPIVVHKALTILIEAMGQRMKKIHVISGSKFFDTIFTLFKQGLSTKLKQRLIVHPDLESLYAYFPKEQLPLELGGNERSVKELNDALFNEISSDKHIEQVKFLEKAVTDESFRLSSKFNEEYSGMSGSFKVLTVD